MPIDTNHLERGLRPIPMDRRNWLFYWSEVRLHESEFRELVLCAYDRRCAISGLPVPGLLDAAHINP